MASDRESRKIPQAIAEVLIAGICRDIASRLELIGVDPDEEDRQMILESICLMVGFLIELDSEEA